MPLTTQAVRLPLGSACCPFKNSLCCRQTSRGLNWVDLGTRFLAKPTDAVEIKQVNDSEHQATTLLSLFNVPSFWACLRCFFFSFFKHMLLKFNPFSLSMETICQYNTSPSDAYDSWNKCSLKVKSSSNKKWLLTRWEALRGNVLLLSDRNLKHFFFCHWRKKIDPIYQFPQSDKVAGSSFCALGYSF